MSLTHECRICGDTFVQTSKVDCPKRLMCKVCRDTNAIPVINGVRCRYCSPCHLMQPLTDFDGAIKTCRRRRAMIAANAAAKAAAAAAAAAAKAAEAAAAAAAPAAAAAAADAAAEAAAKAAEAAVSDAAATKAAAVEMTDVAWSTPPTPTAGVVHTDAGWDEDAEFADYVKKVLNNGPPYDPLDVAMTPSCNYD